MRIVYLIGNGVDMNLGLNTDYSSFYKYYNRQKSPNPAIEKLKFEIMANYKNWADLEEALGKYLSTLTNNQDAISIHKDLLNHLQTYICKEDSNYLPPEDSSKNIFKELFWPVKSLRPNQRREFNN